MKTEDKTKLNNFIAIADIHQSRIELALNYANKNHLEDLTAKNVTDFSLIDLSVFELLTNRFGKLQDCLGSKILPFLLKVLLEDNETFTQIDMLNKLEKLGYIPSVAEWTTMREMRNHFTHEYPNQPEITAANLNEAIKSAKYLIAYWQDLKQRLSKL